MKKEIELSRRICDDRNFELGDSQPKTGEEHLVTLPHENLKKAKWELFDWVKPPL